ncbi:type II CAAX prenyl endopeptidase Rce1 family protein [Lacisediminihabitans sp.]|uniref:CPBP family glutamic-type intramembrane protease n=1 Tax=Lacisediminihabitans sp. TaxID=2787631 RepID=UPI00374D565B
MSVADPRALESPRTAPPALSWNLLPAAGVSASAVLLFGVQEMPAGYATLAASLIAAFALDRDLFRSLTLVGAGLGIVSTISVAADISYANIALMGTVLSLAIAVPYAVERWGLPRLGVGRGADRAIRFPINTGHRWTRLERSYLPIVLVLGYFILPFYFIGSGAYLNWPAIHAPDELARLFVGVNFVGIWDEMFFICVVFALLRRHFVVWQANLLQAVIFVSFLWELGYRGWGPLMTFPFALLQGYIFTRTRSLTYVVCVHLLFDLVVFLVLVHAHNPGWLRIFLY